MATALKDGEADALQLEPGSLQTETAADRTAANTAAAAVAVFDKMTSAGLLVQVPINSSDLDQRPYTLGPLGKDVVAYSKAAAAAAAAAAKCADIPAAEAEANAMQMLCGCTALLLQLAEEQERDGIGMQDGLFDGTNTLQDVVNGFAAAVLGLQHVISHETIEMALLLCKALC